MSAATSAMTKFRQAMTSTNPQEANIAEGLYYLAKAVKDLQNDLDQVRADVRNTDAHVRQLRR
jgi:hypothetical protein